MFDNKRNEEEVLSHRGWEKASKVFKLLHSGKKFKALTNIENDDLFIDYHEIHIIEKIGQGAFAFVYLAEFKGQQVAVKVLKHEHLKHVTEVKLFLDEVKIMKKLNHKNVIELIGMGGLRDDQTGKYMELFVVTELLRGGSLRLLVQRQMIILRRHLYSLEQALRWCRDIASALQYLHNAKPKLVHRDVKLENVILTSEDLDQASVKLVDFGLAAFIKVVGDSKYQKIIEESNLPEKQWSTRLRGKSQKIARLLLDRISSMPIRSGSISSDAVDSFEGEITGIAGSYGYMAPEVFNGQPYNQKADIFSFGVFMYNLCYRIVPSLMIMSNGDRQDMVVLARKVSQGYRQPLNDQKAPPSVNELIASCWHESPESRPSASSIMKTLSEILEKEDLAPFEKVSFSSCSSGGQCCPCM